MVYRMTVTPMLEEYGKDLRISYTDKEFTYTHYLRNYYTISHRSYMFYSIQEAMTKYLKPGSLI